jgi:hypothetical protein
VFAKANVGCLGRSGADESLSELWQLELAHVPHNIPELGCIVGLTIGSAQHLACWPIAAQMLMKSSMLVGVDGAIKVTI